MRNKIKKVKDKEGVLFVIEKDSFLDDYDRLKPSVIFLERHFNRLLQLHNVESKVLGVSGEISHISQFLSYFLEQFHKEEQFYQIDEDDLVIPYLGEDEELG